MAHMDNTIKQTITWQRACHAQVFPGYDTSCFLKNKTTKTSLKMKLGQIVVQMAVEASLLETMLEMRFYK